MSDLDEKLSEISEKTEAVFSPINKTIQTDAFKEIEKRLKDIPDDMKKTVLYNNMKRLEKAEITYSEIEWIQKTLGDKSFDKSVLIIRNKKNKSEVDKYVLSVIESKAMMPREKAVVLLAHFETLVYQALDHERKANEKVKNVISEKSNKIHSMKISNFQIIFLAAIVSIVFSNTDGYKNKIDMRIPFRNNILHRGTMAYSDIDIKKVYEILVYFISNITLWGN